MNKLPFIQTLPRAGANDQTLVLGTDPKNSFPSTPQNITPVPPEEMDKLKIKYKQLYDLIED